VFSGMTKNPLMCETGSYRSTPGAASQGDCTDCPTGYYCVNGTTRACQSGTFCPTKSGASVTCPGIASAYVCQCPNRMLCRRVLLPRWLNSADSVPKREKLCERRELARALSAGKLLPRPKCIPFTMPCRIQRQDWGTRFFSFFVSQCF
jgi:hypothetical protein